MRDGNDKVELTFRERYERWFQGWLVLAPVTGLGSITLVKNQLYRVWKVQHGLTDGVSAQQAHEMGLTPPDWSGAMWYGVATVGIFTVFYALAARTWAQTPTSETNE
ncbi:MAG: hypothetical protein ACPG66_01805 [Flavobacteriales bacterium]